MQTLQCPSEQLKGEGSNLWDVQLSFSNSVKTNKQSQLLVLVLQSKLIICQACPVACIYFMPTRIKQNKGRTISVRSVEAVLHRPLLSRRNFTVIFNFAFLKSIVHIPRGRSSQQILFDSHHHWHCNALVVRTLCPLTASVPVPRQVLKHSYFRIPGLSSYPLHIIT